MAEEIKQDNTVLENTVLTEPQQKLPEDVLAIMKQPGFYDLSYLAGLVETVTTIPTHVPSRFEQQVKIYVDSVTAPTIKRLYIYSNKTNTWYGLDILPSQTGNSGNFLTTNGSGVLSWGTPTVPTITVPVTAGEVLSVGEVVCLKLGTGSGSTQGYGWTNGAVYAVRAAANDTTYGENVLGVMTSATTYLGTGTCALIGDITGMSGLTAGSKHYLSNYTGTSTAGISQTTEDATFRLFDASGATTLTQLFVPTSSRLDKIIIKAKKIGGFTGTLDCSLMRASTVLETVSLNPTSSLAEVTYNFTDVRVYKGEIIKFTLKHVGGIPAQTDAYYIAFQSSGDAYAGQYQGDSSGIDLIGPSTNGTGTISSSGTAITGSSTAFDTQLHVGDCITAGGQIRVVATITDATNMTVSVAFSPDVSSSSFVYGVPASGADLYFKVYEYPDFGKVGTSAGTRKFKIGTALSTTELALNMQDENTIL